MPQKLPGRDAPRLIVPLRLPRKLQPGGVLVPVKGNQAALRAGRCQLQPVGPLLQSAPQALVGSQRPVGIGPEPPHIPGSNFLARPSVRRVIAVPGLGLRPGDKIPPAILTPRDPLSALLKIEGQLRRNVLTQHNISVILRMKPVS